MPAIDINAAEETQGLKFRVLGPQFVNGDDGSASGTSASYSGFSAFSSVFLVVEVALRQGYREHPLTITVEHSDDGLSWSTAHTFSFSSDGSPSSTLTAPKDYIRALWSAGPGSEWSIVSVDAVAPTGGGATPVSCLLIANGFDVHDVGVNIFVWSRLVDNTYDANDLAEIPDGLGMDFLFDGSNGLLTVTKAGVFALTMESSIFSDDARWVGHVGGSFSGSGNQLSPPAAGSPFYAYSEILYLPAGATGRYSIETYTQSATTPLMMNGTLSIVRLG